MLRSWTAAATGYFRSVGCRWKPYAMVATRQKATSGRSALCCGRYSQMRNSPTAATATKRFVVTGDYKVLTTCRNPTFCSLFTAYHAKISSSQSYQEIRWTAAHKISEMWCIGTKFV